MEFITYEKCVEYNKNVNSKRIYKKIENDNIECYDKKKIKEVDKRHDKMIRKVLSIKKEMVMFLNQFLNFKEEIKEEQIEQCNSDFITRQYKDRQADIIYRVKDKKIYFLIEHQSTVNQDMILRIWEYVGEIMRREVILQQDKSSRNKIYPIVIPIVIYTGYQRWNAKTKLLEKQYNESDCKEYQNNLHYNLITVHDNTVEELLKKKSLFGSIMILEKCKTEPELIQRMNEIVKIITEPEQKEVLSEIILNILSPALGKEKADEIIEKIYEEEDKAMSPLTKMLFDIEIRGKKSGIKKRTIAR